MADKYIPTADTTLDLNTYAVFGNKSIAVSNASGVILVGLPTGRTGTGVGGSCTAAGNNLAGQSSIYGAVFLPGSATPPGPNEVAFGTIDRTTGSTQSGITASVCGVFVMSN